MFIVTSFGILKKYRGSNLNKLNILKDFFDVDTIPSLSKPSHILENTNREYRRKFSKIKKL